MQKVTIEYLSEHTESIRRWNRNLIALCQKYDVSIPQDDLSDFYEALREMLTTVIDLFPEDDK